MAPMMSINKLPLDRQQRSPKLLHYKRRS